MVCFHDVYKSKKNKFIFGPRLLFEYGFDHQALKSYMFGHLTSKTSQLQPSTGFKSGVDCNIFFLKIKNTVNFRNWVLYVDWYTIT
jgi:hypothetical protein